nr:MAG TPA: Baseplate wedge protein [Herelleviridae sp.]
MARYKKHTIVYGETMQSIAQLETKSVDNWVKIAEYNSLVYPYIVDTMEEKMKNIEHLATLGDVLMIPDEGNLLDIDTSSLNQRDTDFLLGLALGKDLDMTSDTTFYENHGTSDEVFALTHNGHGDLKNVSGADNIKQATISRLMTAKGSLMLHPEYGSDLHLMFGKATVEQMKIISIEICDTVLKDSRVAECVLVNHYIEEDHYVGNYRATLQSTRDQFEFVVQNDNAGALIIS